MKVAFAAVLASFAAVTTSFAQFEVAPPDSEALYMVDMTIWRNDELLAKPALVLSPADESKILVDIDGTKVGIDMNIADVYERYDENGKFKQGMRVNYKMKYFSDSIWYDISDMETAFMLDKRVKYKVNIKDKNIPNAPNFGKDEMIMEILVTKYKEGDA